MKPESYCRTLDNNINQPPLISKRRLDLTVRVLAAQGLNTESRSRPDAFVKCELHVESSAEWRRQLLKEGKYKRGEWKQRTSVRHSRDPDFAGELIRFENVEGVVPELSFLR